jgi:quercetin dioxygenase-like cupin family protein
MNPTVHIPAGTGREFAWKSDHAYVKFSSEDTGGSFTLIEDNLTTEFHLPRHMHREHSETFVVFNGQVEFVLDDRTVIVKGGDTLHIPAGQPHEVRCLEPAKMLTLFQPAGLEKLFEAYANMTAEDMADTEKLKAIDLAHDNIIL